MSMMIRPISPRFGALSLCEKRFFSPLPDEFYVHRATREAVGRTIQKQLDWKPGWLRWTEPLALRISKQLDAMGLDVKLVPHGGDMSGGPIPGTYHIVLGEKGALMAKNYDPWGPGNQIDMVETDSPTTLLETVPFAVARHYQKQQRP